MGWHGMGGRGGLKHADAMPKVAGRTGGVGAGGKWGGIGWDEIHETDK